ncbi:hypothetical protein ACLK19_21555 [Escherichia coli]
MAQLGVTRLVDSYYAPPAERTGRFHRQTANLALSKPAGDRRTASRQGTTAPKTIHRLITPPNAQLLQQAKPFVDERQSKTFWFDIRNTHRSVGASLSGYIAQRTAIQGRQPIRIKAYFNGTAGQSFGVWNAGGVELYLTLGMPTTMPVRHGGRLNRHSSSGWFRLPQP